MKIGGIHLRDLIGEKVSKFVKVMMIFHLVLKVGDHTGLAVLLFIIGATLNIC